jgi:pimeloyl-ACP methyl ester carboxylesterase
MRRVLGFRTSIVVLTILAAATPRQSLAVDTAVLRAESMASPSNIVIGFVGGFVAHDNLHHGPVQLAQRIRHSLPKDTDTYVRVFENRRRKLAYDTVITLLDINRDGVLSADEKTRAHIILFGHSWGASAAVMLARDLRRQGIPVLLTVQVDSVAKVWQNDSIIPDNVAEAVNFYQTQGIIHGRRHITAADPSRTDILGNYLMDYKKAPVQCRQYSWFAHVVTPGHMQSECDSTLWSKIEDMVAQRLSPKPTSAAVAPIDPPHPMR